MKPKHFGLFIMALLIAASLGLVYAPRLRFSPQWDEYNPEICHLGSGNCELSPKAASIWSEESIKRYRFPRGVGAKISFNKVLPSGKDAGTKYFVLVRWEKFQEEHDNEARISYIEQKQAEFEKLLKWWRSPQPDHRKVMLVTDTTGGIQAKEAAFIGRNFNYLQLAQSAASGDSLELTTCLVTDDPDATCKLMSIPAEDAGKITDAAKKERGNAVGSAILEISKESRKRDQTALYERLRSQLAEMARAGTLPEEVHVYTDGMEFAADGVDFYRKNHKQLMDKEQWSELAKLVDPEGRKFPNLRGISFTLYWPHREMAANEKQEVDAALGLLGFVLKGHEASVNIVKE